MDIDIINKLIMLMVNIPKPISIIKPNITGDNALAKTILAWSKPLILPRFSTPYNSAHSAPINGAPIPMVIPSIEI